MATYKSIITEKDIEVSIWLISKPGSQLKATARVKIGPVTIDNFRILQSNDGKGFWMDAPTRGKDFKKSVWLDKDLFSVVQEIAIKKYLESGSK